MTTRPFRCLFRGTGHVRTSCCAFLCVGAVSASSARDGTVRARPRTPEHTARRPLSKPHGYPQLSYPEQGRPFTLTCFGHSHRLGEHCEPRLFHVKHSNPCSRTPFELKSQSHNTVYPIGITGTYELTAQLPSTSRLKGERHQLEPTATTPRMRHRFDASPVRYTAACESRAITTAAPESTPAPTPAGRLERCIAGLSGSEKPRTCRSLDGPGENSQIRFHGPLENTGSGTIAEEFLGLDAMIGTRWAMLAATSPSRALPTHSLGHTCFT